MMQEEGSGPVRKSNRKRSGRWKRWLMRTVVAVFAVALLLVCTGWVYQLITERLDERNYTAPGRLVDIGDGTRIHLYCKGKGTPTVLLDAASDSFSSSWFWVQEELASTVTACAYDRLNQGWSDTTAQPRHAEQITEELHDLIAAAELPPPYVLVGHSLGGLHVQLYAAKYPEHVAGLVLVDPGNEHAFEQIPQTLAAMDADKRLVRTLATISRFGLTRLADVAGMNTRGLPERQVKEARMFASRPDYWHNVAALMEALPDTYASVKQAERRAELPFAVISAGTSWLVPNEPQDEIRRQMNALHAETAAAYANGRHLVLEEASHMSIVHDASHARVVAETILDVAGR